MPLRPQLDLRTIRAAPYIRTHTRCLNGPRIHPTRPQWHRPPPHTSLFHTTASLRDSLANHYETLELQSSASPQEIKRQFFALSKKHHPDHNPNDAAASTKFVEISEAYHVLSVPDKRAAYDHQLNESQGRGGRRRFGGEPSHGSYSSASYAGGRSPTGLNKKRGTFRGPPPSFYKAGGYGRHGAKRTEHAHSHPSSSTSGQEANQESYGDFGAGLGPGEAARGNHVPHFDDVRHKKTHDTVHEHIYGRRKRQRFDEAERELDRTGPIINFLVVSGILSIIGATAVYFGNKTHGRKEGKPKKDGVA